MACGELIAFLDSRFMASKKTRITSSRVQESGSGDCYSNSWFFNERGNVRKLYRQASLLRESNQAAFAVLFYFTRTVVLVAERFGSTRPLL